MTDIRDKNDIINLIDTFYTQVRGDEVIGHVFNTIIGDDWSHHLPLMYTFWNTVLFGAEGYKGNAVGKHIGIDKKIPLKTEYYERWMQLWTSTVDALFTGEIAEDAKKKALAMMKLIQFKVAHYKSGKSLL